MVTRVINGGAWIKAFLGASLCPNNSVSECNSGHFVYRPFTFAHNSPSDDNLLLRDNFLVHDFFISIITLIF